MNQQRVNSPKVTIFPAELEDAIGADPMKER